MKGFRLPSNGIDLRQTLSALEDHYITQAVERCDGNLSRAAELLSVNRTTLVEKIKRKELPYVSTKLEVTIDPEGEFTYAKNGNRWDIMYKGDVLKTVTSLAQVNTYIKEKINE